MNASVPGVVERVFAQFLDLERLTRAARTTDQLAYSTVNDGQPLFGFRHAALVIAGKVRAVTGVSVIDPNAPFVAFVEHAVAQLFAGESRASQCRCDGYNQRFGARRLAKPVGDPCVLAAVAGS